MQPSLVSSTSGPVDSCRQINYNNSVPALTTSSYAYVAFSLAKLHLWGTLAPMQTIVRSASPRGSVRHRGLLHPSPPDLLAWPPARRIVPCLLLQGGWGSSSRSGTCLTGSQAGLTPPLGCWAEVGSWVDAPLDVLYLDLGPGSGQTWTAISPRALAALQQAHVVSLFVLSLVCWI